LEFNVRVYHERTWRDYSDSDLGESNEVDTRLEFEELVEEFEKSTAFSAKSHVTRILKRIETLLAFDNHEWTYNGFRWGSWETLEKRNSNGVLIRYAIRKTEPRTAGLIDNTVTEGHPHWMRCYDHRIRVVIEWVVEE